MSRRRPVGSSAARNATRNCPAEWAPLGDAGGDWEDEAQAPLQRGEGERRVDEGSKCDEDLR
eukprot:525524-Pyramimonas_sp.AAC.1